MREYIRYIEDLENLIRIPGNPQYDSEEWYIATRPVLLEYLINNYGERELIYNRKMYACENSYHFNEITEADYKDFIRDQVEKQILLLLRAKDNAYRHIFKALVTEYEPLWNVDGEETRTYTRSNTGTQSTESSLTGEATASGTNTGTQSTLDKSSSEVTTSRTTYDDSTMLPKDKQSAKNGLNPGDTVTRTDNLANSLSSSNEQTSEDVRTDNLTETYEEHYKRGGNIGVTSSAQLLTGDIGFWTGNYTNFLEMVTKDIADAISYAVY